jgi:hypothetical protein
MTQPTAGLAEYRSIKHVRAGEITEVVPAGCYVTEADGSGVLRTFPPKMTERYQPVVGDFWIVYDDGYQSISPRAPFVAGYLPIGVNAAAPSHMSNEDIARVCHQVNRAYCASIGDNSQPAWEVAPDWQRASATNGVAFALANPDATPADSHASWLAEKQAAGWIYGPAKDPDKKQHPCCVAYAELPQEQRSKDYVFQAIVRSLAV